MDILIPVLIAAGVGLLIGLGLSIVSTLMAVPVDPKEEALLDAMAGINCGACGYSGCEGYAHALAEGSEDDITLCSPGGKETLSAISSILGLEAGDVKQKTAVVRCQGSSRYTETRADYLGLSTCAGMAQIQEGHGDCMYGCLGGGDCVRACPYDSIYMDHGVARINPYTCRGCEVCVAACPKQLITMIPLDELNAFVLCMNEEKGAVARKQCSISCIGCGLCFKACEYDAITIKNHLAEIHPDKCTACGACVEACPTGAIVMHPKDSVPEIKPHDGESLTPAAKDAARKAKAQAKAAKKAS